MYILLFLLTLWQTRSAIADRYVTSNSLRGFHGRIFEKSLVSIIVWELSRMLLYEKSYQLNIEMTTYNISLGVLVWYMYERSPFSCNCIWFFFYSYFCCLSFDGHECFILMNSHCRKRTFFTMWKQKCTEFVGRSIQLPILWASLAIQVRTRSKMNCVRRQNVDVNIEWIKTQQSE